MTLPADFVAQVQSLLGVAETQSLEDALQGDAVVSIRLNRGKVPAMPLPGEPVAWCPSGCYLPERPSFTFDPLFHAGGYYVQEASSMFVSWVLRHCVGDRPVRMLDLCAAPGGKSTLACDALPDGSILVANEVMRNRVQVLGENLIKWGHPGVVVTHADPADFTPLGPLFDIILVDAPCSGEGMFRKDPVAVDEWSLDNVDLCVRRQRRILSDILPCLKPGGLLLYSTCTYNHRENEENVRWLRDEWGMEVLSVPEVRPEWGILGNLLPGEDFPVYRFLPHRVRGEGFFGGDGGTGHASAQERGKEKPATCHSQGGDGSGLFLAEAAGKLCLGDAGDQSAGFAQGIGRVVGNALCLVARMAGRSSCR